MKVTINADDRNLSVTEFFCAGSQGWEFSEKPESGCEMFITRSRKQKKSITFWEDILPYIKWLKTGQFTTKRQLTTITANITLAGLKCSLGRENGEPNLTGLINLRYVGP